MSASTRTLLVFSLLPPFLGLLSIAGVFTLLFRAVDDIPEGDLLDDPPAFEPPDFESAIRGGAAIILVSSVVILAIIGVFVVHAARRPDLRGSKLALWILLLIFVWPVGPFTYWLAVVRESDGATPP